MHSAAKSRKAYNNFVLMGQFFPKQAINPGACYRAKQSHYDHKKAAPDLRKQRARADSGNCPAKAKNQSTVHISPMEFFIRDHYRFVVNGLYLETFDDLNGNHRHQNSAADDAIHVKGLEMEHLLDTEPGNHLRFNKDNSEQQSGDQKFNVFHSCNK